MGFCIILCTACSVNSLPLLFLYHFKVSSSTILESFKIHAILYSYISSIHSDSGKRGTCITAFQC